MGQLVLLVVAAAWAAVLIPPLLRSRIENRPNSSVSDFRNQLSSLQRAMPSRGVAMRSMARPLAPSPLSRPAATGRPPLRSGVRTHGGQQARTASAAPVSRSGRTDGARLYDATPRARSHGDRPATPSRSAGRPAPVPARAALKRRRANVLFVLAFVSSCSLFLAATTKAPAWLYLFGASFVALAGYVWVLGQLRQREQAPAPALVPAARRPARPVEPATTAPRPVVRHKAHQASIRRDGPARRQAADRWSAAV
ncbi:MAG: hypothetical protein ABWZ99_05895 [Ilumatobacteraceae bacterium]